MDLRSYESQNHLTFPLHAFMNGLRKIIVSNGSYSQSGIHGCINSAPKTIIYDNCCNLHQYCLNREPQFFKESWFVIDRFHWPNHSGKELRGGCWG